MVGEAIAGLSAIKTAFDIAKGLKDIDDATRRNAAVIELQEKILSAQAEQFALIERMGNLEKQVAEFETWDTEKRRYQMRDYGGGTIAYELKAEMASGEPPHRLCAACYQNRKKGLLQPIGPNAYLQEIVKCTECSKEFALGHRIERSMQRRAAGTDFDVFSGR